MSIEIICDSGDSAREWVSKDGERHNIFIKDKIGEVGWIDLKTGKLVNKSQRNYDFVDEDDAKIIIKASDKKLFVGIVGDDEVDEISMARLSLKEATKRFNSLKLGDVEFELNLGPSREIRKGGKSNWAKANITVKVSNPDSIEEVYDSLSDIAFAMLDLETDRLLNDQQA